MLGNMKISIVLERVVCEAPFLLFCIFQYYLDLTTEESFLEFQFLFFILLADSLQIFFH